MQDLSKIARPYAMAAFKQAQDEDTLAEWSAMLEFLASVVGDPTMAGLVSNPNVRRPELAELVSLRYFAGLPMEQSRERTRRFTQDGRATLDVR